MAPHMLQLLNTSSKVALCVCQIEKRGSREPAPVPVRHVVGLHGARQKSRCPNFSRATKCARVPGSAGGVGQPSSGRARGVGQPQGRALGWWHQAPARLGAHTYEVYWLYIASGKSQKNTYVINEGYGEHSGQEQITSRTRGTKALGRASSYPSQ
ncbi:hypothetical protein O6H91_13G016300 [Diphasiastrum complanatum]|uniref:Uncharacterized protein n=1 Tax=Diphasiastrum complanatum TaxID=34168 RepID=A0ACC2BSH6_DIPCM|nr:hypothetical protein O6H91_13G016300 [Diphasiastrum complanatum]